MLKISILDKEKIEKLIEGLEVREKQLLYPCYGEKHEGIDLSYKIHKGHHLQDVITVLAVLKENNPRLNFLLASLLASSHILFHA